MFDLRSDSPFWPTNAGLIRNYPALESSVSCDVAVIGAGITGALVAHRLTARGANVVVLDARNVAHGSTAASTAMLQYEVDTHLSDLIKIHGRQAAERAYRLCLNAITSIEQLCGELGDRCGFERVPSFYFASSPEDVGSLELEHEVRRAAGFELELWREAEIKERYGIVSSAALFSGDAAQVDPYRLAHALLHAASNAGARVFDRTEVESISPHGSGSKLTLANGCEVNAKRVVAATGYESQKYLKDNVTRLHSSFALVTEPVPVEKLWHRKALIWETARPYFYLRTTSDNRILMGGGDIPFRNPKVRDAYIPEKSRGLEQTFKSLFPDIPIQVAYSWAGTFGETGDGLAYVGETEELPGVDFALGFGGNGITFSVVAADLIAQSYFGEPSEDGRLFRFGRPTHE